MDREDNAAVDLERALDDIDKVNRYLGGSRTLLNMLTPHLAACTGTLRILDVGTGGGDLPLAITALADALQREVEIVAIDRDPITVAYAQRATAADSRISVQRADAFSLAFPADSFDLVTVSLFLHHFREQQVVELLRQLSSLTTRSVLINDLRRAWLPWGFIKFVSWSTLRSPMFRHDAPLSVLRGFTKDELEQILLQAVEGPQQFHVRCRWPYRLAAELVTGVPE